MSESIQAGTTRLIARQPEPGMEAIYVLKNDQTTVGRHPSNDIVLPLDSVSRFHARLDKRGDFHILQDLNSSNGSMVNGERVSQMAIHDGDQVAFGNIEFTFVNEFTMDHGGGGSGSSIVGADIVDFEDDRGGTEQSFVRPADVADKVKSSVLGTSEDRQVDKAALFKLNKRLSALYRLSELLRGLDFDKEEYILQRVLDVLFVAVSADRGVILTRFHRDSEQLDVTAVKYRDEPIVPQKVKVSRTILNKVLDEKIGILSRDAQMDDRFKASESIFVNEIRSTICAPMIVGDQVLGALHLDTMQHDKSFDQEDLEFVMIVATETGVALQNMRMQKEAHHRQRLAAVGETVAGISHNVKNILLLSQGGAELLSRALNKDDMVAAKEAWQVVSRGIEKIGKLVRDMLEYSNQTEIELSNIDINDLICSIAEEIEEQLVAKNVTLELDLDEDIPGCRLDEPGLQRTLMNILVNSVEAITHDDGQVLVTTAVRPDEKVAVTIRDNGAGISADKLERIFFPFFTTKGSAGTGLGLSMCKKYIEDMGGSIECESEENVGTTFSLELPFNPEK